MIISESINLENIAGKDIIGSYDYSKTSKENKAFIVIPSSYGETKTDSLSLAYFLAANGFNVIRYDGTDHIGESDGDIFNFTLEKGKNDLISVIDFVKRQFDSDNIGVVAKSLAVRFALRAATQDRRIRFLLGICGIFNLQETLNSVYREDLVDIVLKKKYKNWKFADIFGFEVSRNFLETAIEDNYHSLQGTKDDSKRLTIPSVFLFGEKDTWVNLDNIKEALNPRNGNEVELYILPSTLHQINENPEAALFAFKQTVVSCKKYLCKEKIGIDKVVKPHIREVARETRLERERLKVNAITKAEERMFWQKYLTKYILVDKSEDFQEYMDFIIKLFGTIGEDEVILDAGCGPGHFGTFLLKKNKKTSPLYVGIDFVYPVLQEAKSRYKSVISGIFKNLSLDGTKILYVCGDLDNSWNSENNSHLCFKDNTFNKICCSFLISYIKDPLFLLRECLRILKPEGKIIVTSLKPHADISEIYRNFIERKRSKKEIQEARRLLTSAGKIKQKEKCGYYNFFREGELIKLLKEANLKNVECYKTFGNQANLVIATK